MNPIASQDLESTVSEIVAKTKCIDMHTHLFAPRFGALGLWGIDNLLTYHYLEAELFRFSSIDPERYWSLSKSEQADLIWKTLFVEHTPLSEAARGVIAVMQSFGLDTRAGGLEEAREFFRDQTLDQHLTRVFELAGIESVVMTNDPVDPAEEAIWRRESAHDPRFQAAIRLDRLLNEPDAGGTAVAGLRRFLDDAVSRMSPVYMAVSLPDTFLFPAEDTRTHLLREAVLPSCRDHHIPLALMIGVRRQVNPALRLGGDGVGKADLRSLETLCRDYPGNRFLVTVLSRENQHELCVAARKFANLLPFGCWWFLNNPSMVEEITRERLELLGTSFIPQHSDARILEQVIYKWRNTRRTLIPILTRSYHLLIEDGRAVTYEEIAHDVERLFRGNFESFTHPPLHTREH